MNAWDEVWGGLWIGGAASGQLTPKALRGRFDALVLCAQEYQPPAREFPGVRVIHAGFDDSGVPATDAELRVATEAARRVADHVREGRRVLVTCWAGRNRSGLVTALALRELTGVSGERAAGRVRAVRPGALSNRWFSGYLSSLPAIAHRSARRRP